MADVLLGVALGLIQGISEWLPISSKTQVIIALRYLLPSLSLADDYALGLFLEVGTFFAALVYFRAEVVKVLKALVGKGDEDSRLLLKFLVIATAVTAVLGVAIYEFVSSTLTGPAIGAPMVALGCVLIGDGVLILKSKGRYIPTKGLRDLSARDMLLIGIAQGLAAFPGVSRSGATVSTMLLMRIRPSESFRLSFIALIPASIGATATTLLISRHTVGAALDAVTLPVVGVAIAVSFVVGLATVRVLLKSAESRRIALLTFALGVLAIVSGLSSYLSGFG